MKIKESFLTTGIGSLPYLEAKKGIDKICSSFDIPFWPQLPKKGFKENMYVQFAEGLPALIVDEGNKKVYVQSSKDISEDLGKLYEAYLAEDYEKFGLTKDFAEGFYIFLDAMKGRNIDYVKGQITGPISLGLSVVEENGKSIIYNDTLKEAFIKLLEIKAAHQIDKLKQISKNITIFLDEPYLTNFGSSFVNVGREDAILMLNSIINKIHSKDALSGIHCCGNTDWSLLTETEVGIINFDAYSYAENLSLYPNQIKDFLNRDGYLAWGIVPTSEAVLKESGKSLFDKLLSELEKLEKKGVPQDLLISHSLITPSCGMGTLSQGLTDNIMTKLTEVSRLTKDTFR